MAFVNEEITPEELLRKYPEKYSVLKSHLPGPERDGFPINSWIVDRDRDIYVFMMRCGEVRDPDVYLVLFWGECYVLAKDEYDSMFHVGGGRVVPEVIYISGEIRDRIEEIETLFDDAFNTCDRFRFMGDADVSLAFPKAT